MGDDPIGSPFDILEFYYRIRDLEVDELNEVLTNSELDLQVREVTCSDVRWFNIFANMFKKYDLARALKEAEG